jgi:hypothetical protein
MLQQLANMAPGDLADLLEEEVEQTDEVEDGHLIKYLDACKKEHLDTFQDRRERDDVLWKAHETELAEMGDKEDWQSKIVLNKPFTTVIQAKSLVRRGLLERPEYFGLIPTDDKNIQYKLLAEFWEKGLKYWSGTRDADVPRVFSDSAEMGFTIGKSMATKIQWVPDEHGVFRLKLVNIEPWKIYDDPDRTPRQPWSGLYCIHEELVPFHLLKEREAQGYYQNVDKVRPGKGSATTSSTAYRGIDEDEDRRRKTGQSVARNPYRKDILVQEFWGSILDENGDLVMSNSTFTSANNIIIRRPKPNRCRRLRWPWVEFAPLPHLLNFHGYGIYEGVLAMWKFQMAVLNLFIDNENWRINNMFEIDLGKLDDPGDLEIYPLKKWLKKRGAEGPAITPVLKGESNLQDVNFMWALAQNEWEGGSFITELMKGSAGERRDKTATEIQMKLQQGMGVFDSIGKDVEKGAEDLLWAMKEMLTTYWDDFDHPSLQDVYGNDPVYQGLMQFGMMDPQTREQILDLDCQVRIQGVSRLFDRENLIQKIQTFMSLTGGPDMANFRKPFVLITKLGEALTLSDAVLTETELQQQMQQQRMQQLNDIVHGALSKTDEATPSDGQPGGPAPAQPAASPTEPKPSPPAQGAPA